MSKFKVGDKVKVLDAYALATIREIGTHYKITYDNGIESVMRWFDDELEFVPTPITAEEASMLYMNTMGFEEAMQAVFDEIKKRGIA